MSLGGRCVWPGQFNSGRRQGLSDRALSRSSRHPNRNSIPLALLSRIPTASLGEPDGEGAILLRSMIAELAASELQKRPFTKNTTRSHQLVLFAIRLEQIFSIICSIVFRLLSVSSLSIRGQLISSLTWKPTLQGSAWVSIMRNSNDSLASSSSTSLTLRRSQYRSISSSERMALHGEIRVQSLVQTSLISL
jgi:hypothetical protein